VDGKRSVVARQINVNALAGAVTTLLLDISGTLNNVIAALGLSTSCLLDTSLGESNELTCPAAQALAFAQPLVAALSNLLLALAVVVNDLLAVVQQLLNGLLIGLSAALAGLVL